MSDLLDTPTVESIDGLFRNKIRVIQAVRGYRVSEDALILAWFVRPSPRERILDVGTGCGVIAFGLAVREPTVTVIGLEIQGSLAHRAARGVKLNDLETQVGVVHGDLQDADRFFRNGCFDVVVCNPPYHETGRGRMNLHEEKALCRHQVMMPLNLLFRAGRSLLKPSGRLCVIYPASGWDRLREASEETGFRASRVLWIHPNQGARACLLCMEARPEAARVTTAQETLCLYQAPGKRTAAAEAILAGEDFSVPSTTEAH